MAAAQSPAALLGPCIERIHQGASGRKYGKLRQDAKVCGYSRSLVGLNSWGDCCVQTAIWFLPSSGGHSIACGPVVLVPPGCTMRCCYMGCFVGAGAAALKCCCFLVPLLLATVFVFCCCRGPIANGRHLYIPCCR